MLLGLPGLILFYTPFLFIKNSYLAISLGFSLSILIFILYKQFNKTNKNINLLEIAKISKDNKIMKILGIYRKQKSLLIFEDF